MKKVLIAGGTGLIGNQLTELLLNKGYTVSVLSRTSSKKNNKNNKLRYYKWNIEDEYIDIEALKDVNHIINLAGAGIADKNWTNSRKNIILSTRVNSTMLILKTLKENNNKVNSFISASAIGYYGTNTTENIYTEDMAQGNDFLSEVCYAWENEANKFPSNNVSERTVILRIGIVLSNKGGALKKMIAPIKLFIGATLGSGKQYMPWIHIDDLNLMIKYVMETPELHGVFNAVAPEHITNFMFTRILAKEMQRPLLLPNIPSLVIKLIFGGSSVLLLKGSRISSKKIISKGFKFTFDNLKNALQNLIGY